MSASCRICKRREKIDQADTLFSSLNKRGEWKEGGCVDVERVNENGQRRGIVQARWIIVIGGDLQASVGRPSCIQCNRAAKEGSSLNFPRRLWRVCWCRRGEEIWVYGTKEVAAESMGNPYTGYAVSKEGYIGWL